MIKQILLDDSLPIILVYFVIERPNNGKSLLNDLPEEANLDTVQVFEKGKQIWQGLVVDALKSLNSLVGPIKLKC